MQRILRFLRGYVKIRIKGYSPERFLNLCSHHQIDIWGLQPCKNSCEKNAHEGRFSGTLRHAIFSNKMSEQNMVSRRSCALYTPVDVLHFVYLGYPF